MSDDRLMTVKEVDFRVGLSPAAIYRRVQSDELPAFRLGSGPKARLRISEAELEDWLYDEPKEA